MVHFVTADRVMAMEKLNSDPIRTYSASFCSLASSKRRMDFAATRKPILALGQAIGLQRKICNCMGGNQHCSHFFHHSLPTWINMQTPELAYDICKLQSLHESYESSHVCVILKAATLRLSQFQPIRGPHRLCSSGHATENPPPPAG